MNRYSQFPFNNCINKRILHWDEPSFEPSALESLKMLFSGDETPANIKHQDFGIIGKTPVIVTTNRRVFPKSDVFDSRIYYYNWNTAQFLKDWEKDINPISLYLLFKKFNLLHNINYNQ